MTERETFKYLFAPIKIGGLELKNRIIMAPMLDRLAVDRAVSQPVKDFYAARARGGVSLIVLTPGTVDINAGGSVQLGLYEDRFIDGLRELAEVVHTNGALIGIQMLHSGRVNVDNLRKGTGQTGVAASPIPLFPGMEPPKEISKEEIEELIEKFSEAARRVRDAGFDLVEVHAAHGNLLGGFLSPNTNIRSDEYGGDLKNRARFMVKIIHRIREKLGGFPISCRINGADYVPEGLILEESKAIARLLEEAGTDLISVSAGLLNSYPNCVPLSDFPHGCFVHLAEGVKSAVKVPVMIAGRLDDLRLADEVLASGKADLIAIGRALIADSELPKKAMMEEFGEIRSCIACNVCTDTNPAPITCTVNPEAGREGELHILPCSQQKRVLVVGGGLAGLEAARIAALRGHQVSLYEEDERIGGQWILAATPPHKQKHIEIINHLYRELERLEVRMNLGKRVTPDMVEELQPDVVVVATGGTPLMPPIPGIEQDRVITAWDVLQGYGIGSRVLVIGGGTTGLETAEFLAEQGKEVVVVEQLKRAGMDMGFTARWHLMHRLRVQKVSIFTSTIVKEIGQQRVVITSNQSEDTLEGFDNIVLATGVKPRNELVKELESVVKEICVIGDAAEPRKGLEAMREGAEIGRKI